jgi:CubicO group peptidase (beta-lactamase class C family)
MKRILLLLTAVALLAASCETKKPGFNPSALEVYSDSLFQASLDSAQIAGGAILVFQKGEMLLKKSYGFASLELAAPMPEDGQFEIGSVTKQFTAASILKLVEAGKLSLEDDFTEYIDFDTKGRKVTINNLLNHTSGIASYTEIPEFWELSLMEYPRDTLVRMVEGKEFLFEPNEALIYNNSGYFFLGLIIEKVTEMSYEDYLKQVFFEPLGMNNTSYCSNTNVVNNKVYGYDYTPEGLKQKGYLNHTWPYAAGSLCSTTHDLLTWMSAMHTGKLLPEALYQSLITPDQLNDGSQLRYAKGLDNFSNFGHQEIAHGGGINGFLSDTRYFPEEDLYIICLINTTGPHGAGFFAEKLTWKLLEKKENEGVDLDIDTKDLEGKYTGAVRGYTQTLAVKAIPNGLTLQEEKSDKVDSLTIYAGNNTWVKGNTKITIQNNEYRIDQPSAYYILKKVE